MNNAKLVKDLIRSPYAWPGGYPLYAITSDGGTLCKDCCKSEFRNIVDSIHTDCDDGWKVEAVTVNWESTIYCDHCGNIIESAYDPVD